MVTHRRAYYSGLLLVCVAARLATTIYYIEDTDSLRFALSVYDEFDLARLQPHFPGYPVFWAAAKAFYLITGSFAISFSLIGGLSTFAVVFVALRLSRRDPLSREGLAIAFVLFFNPMIWLMGNRYMPDLMGLAIALGALLLLSSRRGVAGALLPLSSRRSVAGGTLMDFLAGTLTGLLAGTRLSYLPLLLPSYVQGLRHRPLRLLAATLAGVLVWLVPLVVDTSWSGLIGAATRQTEGHFTEFGGGVATNPDVVTRFVRLLESVWADGFGAWWPGRHWLTLIVALCLVAALAAAARGRTIAAVARGSAIAGARAARRGTDRPHGVNNVSSAATDRPGGPSLVPSPLSTVAPKRTALLTFSALIYALWIFLFQNVIYKSRHVLPLVALLAIPMGIGLARWVGSGKMAARVVALAGALAYAAVTFVLVSQHREPTSIAQVKTFVEDVRPDVVASIPLVNYYLSSQGVEATFLSVQSDEDRSRIRQTRGKLLIIGRYPDLMPPNPARADTFYHNPYVNRMWPDVEVYVYDR